MNRFLAVGLRELSRGFRRGNGPLAAFGALAFGIGLIRRFSRAGPERVYSRTLRPGQGLRIEVREGPEVVDGGSAATG